MMRHQMVEYMMVVAGFMSSILHRQHVPGRAACGEGELTKGPCTCTDECPRQQQAGLRIHSSANTQPVKNVANSTLGTEKLEQTYHIGNQYITLNALCY